MHHPNSAQYKSASSLHSNHKQTASCPQIASVFKCKRSTQPSKSLECMPSRPLLTPSATPCRLSSPCDWSQSALLAQGYKLGARHTKAGKLALLNPQYNIMGSTPTTGISTPTWESSQKMPCQMQRKRKQGKAIQTGPQMLWRVLLVYSL